METFCVLMVGPDDQMDMASRGNFIRPVNPLPVLCPHCTFPNLDYVAEPYLLARGITSPAETFSAMRGNFLVRERVKRILEVAVPNACTFHPTAELKSKTPTPWWLAVPNQKLATRRRTYYKTPPARCSKCGELQWDFSDDWDAMNDFNSGGVDVFKSLAWSGTDAESWLEDTNRSRKDSGEPPLPWSYMGLAPIEPPPHPERWTRGVDRNLYFSVRLEQLLKRAKVKGQLVRYYNFKDMKTTPEDEAWIQEKLQLLAKHGLLDAPKPAAGKSASAAQKWFKQFLKRTATKGLKPVDFAAVEQERKLALPQDYKDFIATVGPKSFADVCDMEGSATTVLPPQKLDFKNYRRGQVPHLEGDDAAVDGVMFAANDGGDCFVFDVSVKGGDYPVFWYRHEENTLEPFAPNFAECIKRFVQRN